MNRKDAIHLSRDTVGTLSPAARPGYRILLYSHDSYGLGHLRRNLAIAGALLDRGVASSALIVTGSPCATQFPAPEHCEILKMPAVGKDSRGNYVPRHLDIPLDRVIALRRQLILDTYRAFEPDLIIVDHQPAGLMGEMLDTLKDASERRIPAVFGMRDIVYAPDAVEAAWSSRECLLALRLHYSRILVYGDPAVFDPLVEYPMLREFRHKLSSTGYLAARQRHAPDREQNNTVLVTVGGGDDGVWRVETYLDALALAPVPWRSVIVTGPLMPDRDFRRMKHRVRRLGLANKLRIYRFHGDVPGLMRQAAAVVGMAGYNSCVDLLRLGVPAVLMPRDRMRQEQAIRARRLSALGLATVVDTGDAAALRKALDEALQIGRQNHTLDMGGLDRLCDEVRGLVGGTADSAPRGA